MEPLAAVQSARVYHRVNMILMSINLFNTLYNPKMIFFFYFLFCNVQLIPNVVSYEDWTVVDGEHIELSEERKQFLRERGHQLKAKGGGAICQLVVQNLTNTLDLGRKIIRADNIVRGTLTAVSDPRKGGWPAAM